MAKIIDPVKVDETDTSPVLEESDSTQNEVQEEVAELPEQYKDKSPADLVKMHQELENKLGEQGSELGKLRSAETEVKELRRVVDDFVLVLAANATASFRCESDPLQYPSPVPLR